MTEGTSPTPPVADAPVRELRRSRDDRVIAGVAGGLGRYFDLPPIFFRVAFVVLALLGGAGILAYAAAALVMPDEGRSESVLEEALHRHRDRPWLLIGVALVALATLSLIAQARFWPNGGFAWVLLLLGALAIVASQRREERRNPPVVEGAEPVPVEPRPPSIALPVLGLLLAAGGLLALLDVLGVSIPWDIALAIGAIVIGIAVAAGALLHRRTGGLFLVGLILAGTAVVVSTIDVTVDGPVGDRVSHPMFAADVQRTYDVAAGDLVVDLSDVTLRPGTTNVDANVGVGQLTVRLPDDATVRVQATAGLGHLSVLGRTADGWDPELNVTENALGATSELVLDADVGIGNVRVVRTP